MQQIALPLEENTDFHYANDNLLPPPTRELIYLIIRGWGLQAKMIPKAYGRYPEPSYWIPAFMEIMSRSSWLAKFKEYAVMASMNDHSSELEKGCVLRAFHWPNIECHLRKELINIVQSKIAHI